MTRSNTNSATTVLIILLLVFTFPIWIGLAGGLFGLLMGLIGAAIGIVAGVFGAILGVFGAIISGLFGGWWPDSYTSLNVFLAIVLVVAIVMMSKTRKNKT
ncbi:MAG TPA: hypothetical protein VFM90_03185 [Cyclobacteriaceae bacterium]|nr:hypothetical protein [Cyclobacteriaceae bacterium]